MNRSLMATLLLASLGLFACAPYRVFPPEVLEGVDPNFDFTRWRMMPNKAQEQKIQLGGLIIQAEAKDGSVTIVTAQLPIVESPAYGPKDTGRRGGEFVVTYRGKIQPKFIQAGNRLIVVGTTRPASVVSVNDGLRSFPTVQAQCLHLWNTGGREISDFPSYGGGYEPLEEQTACATAP